MNNSNILFQDLRNRYQKMKKIISNEEYIKWIENFNTIYPNFFNSELLKIPKDMSKQDQEKIKMMNIFYCAVEQYADENNIEPIQIENKSFYLIEYNDKGYEVGIKTGLQTFFYSKKIEIKDKNFFINFDNIKNNRKQKVKKLRGI